MKVTITLAAAISAAAWQQHGWSTWKGEGCRMAHPTDWSVQDGAALGASVFFMAPVKDSSDTFRENVNLMIQPLNGSSPDDYVRSTSEQITDLLQDGRLLSNEPSGKDGHTFAYSGTMEGRSLRWKATVRFRKDKAYLITFTARATHYDEYLYIAEAMMQSLTLSDP